MGFILLDRILERGPDSSRGFLRLPAGAAEGFPACAAAEAVGQLAAWVAMERSGFRRKPVAGIASSVTLRRIPPGTSRLDLEANIHSLEDDAIAYSGRALAAGEEVVFLQDCVGPMLPLEEFDDPASVRRLHAALLGPGRDMNGGGALDFPRIEARITRLDEALAQAALEVPHEAAFFADHFPRRPVFPATLLLDAMVRLAECLGASALRASGKAASRWVLITDAKIRAFIAPGASLTLEARLQSARESATTLFATAREGGRPVCTARIAAGFEAPP